jgi:hypothetical protein
MTARTVARSTYTRFLALVNLPALLQLRLAQTTMQRNTFVFVLCFLLLSSQYNLRIGIDWV